MTYLMFFLHIHALSKNTIKWSHARVGQYLQKSQKIKNYLV